MYSLFNKLLHLDIEQLNQLKRNKELLITHPDKDTEIVLMDRKDYIHKVLAILSKNNNLAALDKEKYKTKMQLTGIIRKLKSGQLISEKVHDSIPPTGSIIP
uniref:Uncharacterized protein n=1 Tax=Trichobilharzia regenti TaxID=157069 RepID=A0AA85J7F5_TRIRE|nr:unnamed protein product [Trichobilharzia regenti]